jgi:hypothetical protein
LERRQSDRSVVDLVYNIFQIRFIKSDVIDFLFLTQTTMVEIVNNRVSFVDGVQTIDPVLIDMQF